MTNPLVDLAKKYGTDKAGFIAAIYWSFLKDLRHRPLKIFEIGIKEGASLRMWREFFPAAKIHGADIKPIEVAGVSCHRVDQSSQSDLNNVIVKLGGGLDVIIDDGGHKTSHQQDSFLALFPQLADGGIYFIEDIHTSYMPWYVDTERTTVEFLTSCLDFVLLRGSHLCDEGGYGSKPDHQTFCQHAFDNVPISLLRDVGSIHFYPRLAVITKNRNGLVPGSNKPANNGK